MEVWQSVLLAIGGNTILLAVLAWLSRSLVQSFLGKDLERHRSDLARETQAAGEKLRHDLQLAAQEHQVTFSKLHERRATVIGEVYGLLIEAYWEGSVFVSPMDLAGEPDKKEKYVNAMNAMAKFYRFFDKNRIYLPESICSALDTLSKEMRSQVMRVGGYIKYDESKLPPAALEKKFDAWDEAWKYFSEKVPEVKLELERELRALIGDRQSILDER